MQAPVVSRSAHAIEEFGDQAKEQAVAASPWITFIGRLGYAAKGIVYLMVGWLAVQAALGLGGGTTDQKGAMSALTTIPFGKPLLVAVAIGLFGYAFWRLIQAALDTENKGTDAKGLFARAGYLGVGIIYGGLAISALKIALGMSGGQGSSESARDWTAWLLSQPFGAWLVGLAGLAVIGNGLFQFYRAFSSSLCDDLHLTEISSSQVEWVTRIGRAGYAARGVAFGVIGAFLILAAMHANPEEARGLDGALAALAAQTYGLYILGVVAAGLAAYGLFALVEARYRRMVIR